MTPIDALCLLNIYHFEDLAYPGVETAAERRRLMAIAHREFPRIVNVENADVIKEAYDKLISEWGAIELPSNWTATHDYWGAKCFHFGKVWNAPKYGTLFAGSSSGRYMAFDSLEALRSYTHKVLIEIEQEV